MKFEIKNIYKYKYKYEINKLSQIHQSMNLVNLSQIYPSQLILILLELQFYEHSPYF